MLRKWTHYHSNVREKMLHAKRPIITRKKLRISSVESIANVIVVPFSFEASPSSMAAPSDDSLPSDSAEHHLIYTAKDGNSPFQSVTGSRLFRSTINPGVVPAGHKRYLLEVASGQRASLCAERNH